MVMDVFQDFILVTYRPFDVHIFHVKISGELNPNSSPVLQVREINLSSFDVLFVEKAISFIFKFGYT